MYIKVILYKRFGNLNFNLFVGRGLSRSMFYNQADRAYLFNSYFLQSPEDLSPPALPNVHRHLLLVLGMPKCNSLRLAYAFNSGPRSVGNSILHKNFEF